MSADKARVVIDCDPGHDDAVAILLALRFCEVLGITTVSGNAPLAHTTANALAVATLAGTDVPVFSGADRPLNQPAKHAPHVHGATGLGGVELPSADRNIEREHAVDYLVDVCKREPGIWLVPIGPLTNIALALRREPTIVEHIAGISIMGGSATVGNATTHAEFNIWADPEAADVVFGCGAPIRMCGLNLTQQFLTNDQQIERLDALATPRSQFVANLFRFLHDRMDELIGVRQTALHDPCAVLAVTHPELFEFREQPVAVELTGTHTRGMTVVDQRKRRDPGRANVEVGHAIDASAGMDLVFEALAER